MTAFLASAPTCAVHLQLHPEVMQSPYLNIPLNSPAAIISAALLNNRNPASGGEGDEGMGW